MNSNMDSDYLHGDNPASRVGLSQIADNKDLSNTRTMYKNSMASYKSCIYLAYNEYLSSDHDTLFLQKLGADDE